MTNIKLNMMSDMSRDEDVRLMCIAVQAKAGAYSLANLYAIDRHAFDTLFEAAESMLAQIPTTEAQ